MRAVRVDCVLGGMSGLSIGDGDALGKVERLGTRVDGLGTKVECGRVGETVGKVERSRTQVERAREAVRTRVEILGANVKRSGMNSERLCSVSGQFGEVWDGTRCIGDEASVVPNVSPSLAGVRGRSMGAVGSVRGTVAEEMVRNLKCRKVRDHVKGFSGAGRSEGRNVESVNHCEIRDENLRSAKTKSRNAVKSSVKKRAVKPSVGDRLMSWRVENTRHEGMGVEMGVSSGLGDFGVVDNEGKHAKITTDALATVYDVNRDESKRIGENNDNTDIEIKVICIDRTNVLKENQPNVSRESNDTFRLLKLKIDIMKRQRVPKENVSCNNNFARIAYPPSLNPDGTIESNCLQRPIEGDFGPVRMLRQPKCLSEIEYKANVADKLDLIRSETTGTETCLKTPVASTNVSLSILLRNKLRYNSMLMPHSSQNDSTQNVHHSKERETIDEKLGLRLENSSLKHSETKDEVTSRKDKNDLKLDVGEQYKPLRQPFATVTKGPLERSVPKEELKESKNTMTSYSVLRKKLEMYKMAHRLPT